MCGLAGIIHRGNSGPIGRELTSMLQSMKHRGPDSTGFAVYGTGDSTGLVMRLKLAEQEDLKTGIDFLTRLEERREQVEMHIRALGGRILGAEAATNTRSRRFCSSRGIVRDSGYITGGQCQRRQVRFIRRFANVLRRPNPRKQGHI